MGVLGPWVVGDSQTQSLSLTLRRDGAIVPLGGYVSSEAVLYDPTGAVRAWGSAPVLNLTTNVVTLSPLTGPFALAGYYSLYIRLSPGAGATETFYATSFEVTYANSGTRWPPTLDELKTDLKIDLNDARGDERLVQVLNAAVAKVQEARPVFRYDELDSAQFALPAPTADLRLGTLRLAGRWDTRRRSPDGMISMAELGTSRVTSFDADIDRLLGLGRFAPMMFA